MLALAVTPPHSTCPRRASRCCPSSWRTAPSLCCPAIRSTFRSPLARVSLTRATSRSTASHRASSAPAAHSTRGPTSGPTRCSSSRRATALQPRSDCCTRSPTLHSGANSFVCPRARAPSPYPMWTCLSETPSSSAPRSLSSRPTRRRRPPHWSRSACCSAARSPPGSALNTACQYSIVARPRAFSGHPVTMSSTKTWPISTT
mmetsp:Transcript_10047/g.30904  ORF Transcript_10047/g.30904 Transcript_10047/m.30904 type:complete len:203 (-) Transcript_10047:600-1208(-)